MHRQPILRSVQGELGPQQYHWTKELSLLLPHSNPKRAYLDNRSWFALPTYLCSKLLSTITPVHHPSYLPEVLLCPVLSIPFTQLYYNSCGKYQIITTRKKLRIHTASPEHIKRQNQGPISVTELHTFSICLNQCKTQSSGH